MRHEGRPAVVIVGFDRIWFVTFYHGAGEKQSHFDTLPPDFCLFFAIFNPTKAKAAPEGAARNV